MKRDPGDDEDRRIKEKENAGWEKEPDKEGVIEELTQTGERAIAVWMEEGRRLLAGGGKTSTGDRLHLPREGRTEGERICP